MADDAIVLYDLRSHFDSGRDEPVLWSPNAWRVRFALNIKRLPHRTEFVDLGDVQRAVKAAGGAPTQRFLDTDYYSIPIIYDPATQRVVSESQAIVRYLEEQYPAAPTLFPPGTAALQAAFVDSHYVSWMVGIFPIICAQLYEHCTPEASKEYFKATRTAFFQKDWDQLQATGEERGRLIAQFLAALADVRRWIRANGDDALFLTGATVSNADVQVASLLTWAKRAAGVDSDLWVAVAAADEGFWARYMAEFEQYSGYS